jgi:hypothetical protein
MTTLLILLLALVAVDLAVLAGWAYDSRDGRDWQPGWWPGTDSRNLGRAGNWNDRDDTRTPERTAGAATLASWTSSSGPLGRPNSMPSAH